jgi:alpha-L-rhamnosidase
MTIPVNTSATVFIPTTNPATVLESAKVLKSNPAITVKEFKDGYLQLELGSGQYLFQSQN